MHNQPKERNGVLKKNALPEDVRDRLVHGSREEKRALAFEVLSLLMGEDPKPEVAVLRPDGSVFGYFLAPRHRLSLLTIEQLATLDRRHEQAFTPRSFESLESRLVQH